MEQTPSQNKNSAEAGLLREALPFAPGARHGPEHMQPRHDTGLNPFHRPEPMRAMVRSGTEGLPGEVIAGRLPSMATLMGVVEDG